MDAHDLNERDQAKAVKQCFAGVMDQMTGQGFDRAEIINGTLAWLIGEMIAHRDDQSLEESAEYLRQAGDYLERLSREPDSPYFQGKPN